MNDCGYQRYQSGHENAKMEGFGRGRVDDSDNILMKLSDGVDIEGERSAKINDGGCRQCFAAFETGTRNTYIDFVARIHICHCLWSCRTISSRCVV
jgi:hypothetical protein